MNAVSFGVIHHDLLDRLIYFLWLHHAELFQLFVAFQKNP